MILSNSADSKDIDVNHKTAVLNTKLSFVKGNGSNDAARFVLLFGSFTVFAFNVQQLEGTVFKS